MLEKHITLDEAIAHFEAVAKYCELTKKDGSTDRTIAQYLKRLKYLEDKIASGELVWKEGESDV